MRRWLARGLHPRARMPLPANPVTRRGIAVVASLSLLTTLVVAAAPQMVAPAPAPSFEPVAIAPDRLSASVAARRQGSRVEVESLRSESSTTYANPNGSWTLEQSVGPVRVRKGDGWVPIDRTLTKTESGTFAPKASPATVEFSGGGNTPLARFTNGSNELALSWPTALPKPLVDGDSATYPEVLPGVDLRVRATDKGFGHDVVVRTPAAAANPALRRITLNLAVSGVRLSADHVGNLSGVDDAGTPIFTAPAPLMWDSPQDDSPRTERQVGVEIGAGTLTLVPDAALMSAPDARFPLVIDPAYSGHAPNAAGSWTLIRRAFPDNKHWNLQPRDADERDFGVARVGHAPGYPAAYLDRPLFKFNSAPLAGTRIKSATFKIWQVWKYAHSCDPNAVDPMYLYQTGDISPDTTWNQPPPGPDFANWTNIRASARSTPKAGHCPLDWVGMDATHAAQLAANAGAPAIVLGLATSNEADAGWKRFYVQNNIYPYLSIEYNHTPTIGELGTEPALPVCAHCGGVAYAGPTQLNLKGRVSDQDGGQIAGEFVVNRPNQTNASNTVRAGDVAKTPIDTRTIADGTTVTWRMLASDGELWTPYAEGPGFVVDLTKPRRAPKVSAPLYKEDNRWHGGVGVYDTFTFTADPVPDDPATPANEAEVNDIDHYLWGWQDPPATKAVAMQGLGDRATARIAPTGDGPRTLYVQSVDRAGNPSPTREYRIYVRAGNGPLAQYSLENNTQDTAFLGDRHGTLTGAATYTPGAVSNALKLQGGTVVAPQAVAPDGSFSVSAWVRPDSLTQTHVVLSQSGNGVNAFQLGYRPDNGGRWFFEATRSADGAAGVNVVTSPQPAATTGWTHLTGVYDAMVNQLRLYVNGERPATALHTGVPFPAGQVRIGSGLVNGTPQNNFLGTVDEVALYDRALSGPEITAAISQSNVLLANWKFDEAIENPAEPGTTARNSADGGDMGVLQNGAEFTDDAGRGAVKFDGVDDVVTTNKPTIRTDQSFSVAALVWLDPDTANPPYGYTVLSQDGQNVCSFCLQYESAWDTWVFVTPWNDAANASGYSFVRGRDPAKKRQWTHVVGTYDAASDTLALYVDGELAGTQTGAVTWHATGPLKIGESRSSAAPTHHFRGMMDDVRVYSRAIGHDEVRGLVGAAGVTLGSWHLDGDAADSSGNGNDGTLRNQPDWTAGQTAMPDPDDRALRLDGAGAHVSVQHVLTTNQSFSVSLWARADQIGRAAAVVSQDGSSRSEFVVGTTAAGLWSFTMPKDQTTGTAPAEVLGGAAQVGAWTHLVAVYSRDRGRIELYVNGSQVGYTAHTPLAPATGVLLFGRAQLGGQPRDYFDGAVDDVTVYSRALSVAEINTMAGRDLTLIHNWQLDEISGANAADSVGSRGGTLSGAATFDKGRVGNAVWFNGGVVSTTGTEVRTDESFTVSAWVQLEDAGTDGTAVSVDGANTSRFRLGHQKADRSSPYGFWTFEMPVADTTNAVTQVALSTSESDLGKWVHLVGVYDSTAQMMWLYVDGTRQNDNAFNTPWQGTGGLQIGRGKEGGQPARYWSGGVDDVRMYTGALDSDRVSALHDSYPAEAPPATLPAADAGLWTFDEGSGTVVADRSGRGLDATTNASWIGGRKAAAGWLNGTSGYAQTSGPVLDTSKSFSLSTWAYLTTTSGDRTLLAQDAAHESAFQLRYHAAARRWSVFVPKNTTDGTDVLLTATETAWVSEWTHLGVVYEAGDRHLRLYVNGVLAATRYGVAIGESSGPFSIGRGRQQDANAAFFSGGIDDVRVFSDALTDGQMRLVHDDVPPVPLNSWRFDDGTAKDYDPRGNHATVSGGASFGAGISGQALVLDGTDDAADSAFIGVGMRDSFTVSAWAKLNRGDRVATVLSQDGSWMSGFVLQYRPESGKWFFGAYAQDAAGAARSGAESQQPAVLNQWVHLTGTYDRASQQMRLYVNGELSGTRTRGALWAAQGVFAIGRGRVDGAPKEFFSGAIDEARVDQGLVPEADIAARAAWPVPPKGTLGSFVNMAGDHYTASTNAPVLAGYRFERTLGMPLAAEEAGTRVLYSCRTGGDIYTSTSSTCDGQVPLGEVGRLYVDPPADVVTVPVHRCGDTSADRYDSRTGCGATQGTLLGYAPAYAPLSRYHSVNHDHWTTIDGTMPGYRQEGRSGWVSLTEQSGTQPLMSCRDGVDEFTSVDPACEGKQTLAVIGYLYSAPYDELVTTPLYRCRVTADAASERFTSRSDDCEGRTVDRLLGHVLAAPPVPVVQ